MNWYRKKFSFKIDPDKIYIRLLRSAQDIKIWLVNGTYIRNNCFIDYTMGGHDQVYDFIPDNEIWIDNDLKECEIDYVIIHELRERFYMLQGMTYDKAHDKASVLEVACRKNKVDVEKIIQEEISKNLSKQHHQ